MTFRRLNNETLRREMYECFEGHQTSESIVKKLDWFIRKWKLRNTTTTMLVTESGNHLRYSVSIAGTVGFALWERKIEARINRSYQQGIWK